MEYSERSFEVLDRDGAPIKVKFTPIPDHDDPEWSDWAWEVWVSADSNAYVCNTSFYELELPIIYFA